MGRVGLLSRDLPLSALGDSAFDVPCFFQRRGAESAEERRVFELRRCILVLSYFALDGSVLYWISEGQVVSWT